MARKKLPQGEKTVSVPVYVQEKVVDALGKEKCQEISSMLLNRVYVDFVSRASTQHNGRSESEIINRLQNESLTKSADQ